VKNKGHPIYAWALMTDHAHILLRNSSAGLTTFVRRFLSGYAIMYNRRHRRYGHLFLSEATEVIQHAEEKVKYQLPAIELQKSIKKEIHIQCKNEKVPVAMLQSGSRLPPLPKLRRAIVLKLVNEYGLSLAETARRLGISTSGFAHILRRREGV
jgi:DNA-directed RNA polymerase specialized sigma24 family protein